MSGASTGPKQNFQHERQINNALRIGSALLVHKGHIETHLTNKPTQRTKIMTRKTLIALAAAAFVTVGLAASAQAKTNFNFDIGLNLGAPIYNSGYYDAGYDDDYGDDSCGWQLVKHKQWNWNHTHKIVTFKKQWVCY
jgi:hypothetical protein